MFGCFYFFGRGRGCRYFHPHAIKGTRVQTHVFYPGSCLFPTGLVTHHFPFLPQPHCCLFQPQFPRLHLMSSKDLILPPSALYALCGLFKHDACSHELQLSVMLCCIFLLTFSPLHSLPFARSRLCSRSLYSVILVPPPALLTGSGVTCLKGETLGRLSSLSNTNRGTRTFIMFNNHIALEKKVFGG